VAISDFIKIPSVKSDLDNFEAYLRSSVTTENEFLNEVSLHLIDAGGKRLRPALTFIASKINADSLEVPTPENVYLGAVSIELVHLASLYHDDVIDEASMRRNVQTVNSKWGNIVAIVAGDYLLARSAEIAASLGADIAYLLATTLRELCRGQLSEIKSAFDFDRDEENYFSAVKGKTAALISAACKIGAMLSKQEIDVIEALSNYGTFYGIAFQIRDDVLDFIGTLQSIGKAPGQDLIEGIYTLPFIKARQSQASQLNNLIKTLNQDSLPETMQFIINSGAVTKSIEVAQIYVNKALCSVEKLSQTPAKELLEQAANSLLSDLGAFV